MPGAEGCSNRKYCAVWACIAFLSRPEPAANKQTFLLVKGEGKKKKKKQQADCTKFTGRCGLRIPNWSFFFADKKEFDARAALEQRHGFVELDRPWAGSFEM